MWPFIGGLVVGFLFAIVGIAMGRSLPDRKKEG